MSARELARRLEVSPSWVSYRLTGTQIIDLNDLESIAAELDTTAADLMGIVDIDLAAEVREAQERLDDETIPEANKALFRRVLRRAIEMLDEMPRVEETPRKRART